MQKITPCLWFDGQAEEAARFYTSVFPEFKFSEAISFVVHCKTQKQVDRYWDRLLKGGKPVQCGWLTDKFGVSWQIVATIIPEMLRDKNAAKRERVMKAVLGMIKLDIKALTKAYKG